MVVDDCRMCLNISALLRQFLLIWQIPIKKRSQVIDVRPPPPPRGSNGGQPQWAHVEIKHAQMISTWSQHGLKMISTWSEDDQMHLQHRIRQRERAQSELTVSLVRKLLHRVQLMHDKELGLCKILQVVFSTRPSVGDGLQACCSVTSESSEWLESLL